MELLRAEIGAAASAKTQPGEGHAERLRVDSLRKKYQEALVGMRSQQEKALVNVERRHRAALQERVSTLLSASTSAPDGTLMLCPACLLINLV